MKFIFNFFLLVFFLSFYSYTLSQSINLNQIKKEALSLMNSSRYGEAIDLWNKYVSENPHLAEGFNLRGLCYEKRGSYDLAVNDYRTAKKLEPKNQEIISNLNRATNDWYKLLYNKIEGYKREIAVNPDMALNYLEIGKCYKDLGDWKEAETWYDIYLEKQEASADEILRYTEILAKNNNISKGEPILKSFTEKYPDDHRLWSRYGYFLMWLGKNKSAIEAFTKSLEIRPYFKEAMDGLDLAKGKGYVYSINDTTTKFNYGLRSPQKEYIIDKYYRILKKNPDNDETRFKLVEELIKVSRFEEANQQLELLFDKHNSEKKFVELKKELETLRNSYYTAKIEYYKNLLSKNPNNKKTLLELGKYYSYNKDYESAINLYKNYLLNFPGDEEIRFKLVQILIYQNDLCVAKSEMGTLLTLNPEKRDYQLTAARIYMWMNVNLVESEKLFKKVLLKEPDNINVLSELANLEILLDNEDEAALLITKIESIDKKKSDLPNLKEKLEKLSSRLKEKKLYSILEEARNSSKNGIYNSAVDLFKKYLSENGNDKNVSLELADVYLKLNDIKSATEIYDNLLRKSYDYEIDKLKAKTLFWQGDSLLALREFKRLAQNNQHDVEVKLFLGDSYLKNGQNQNAKKVYEDLLSQSPNSHILKTRLSWLGGSDKFSFYNFPTYLQLNPQGYYFVDNTDFKLNNFGLEIDLGLTNSVTLGVSGLKGKLFSKNNNLGFNQIKGSIFIKLNEILNGSASFGQTYFENKEDENIIDLNLTAKKKNIYSVSGFLNYSDASFILYSPYLISSRLNSYFYGINAEYNFKNKVVIRGKTSRIDISDQNYGEQLQARIGKVFDNDITAGYEYYFYSFDKQVFLYWSPKNFESHSIWLDWDLYRDEMTTFVCGGKVGLIPQNNYVLSEFYASFSYRFDSSISLNIKFNSGSSSRSNVGYRSNSFQAGIFWNL